VRGINSTQIRELGLIYFSMLLFYSIFQFLLSSHTIKIFGFSVLKGILQFEKQRSEGCVSGVELIALSRNLLANDYQDSVAPNAETYHRHEHISIQVSVVTTIYNSLHDVKFYCNMFRLMYKEP
jgi:hypothetical protein